MRISSPHYRLWLAQAVTAMAISGCQFADHRATDSGQIDHAAQTKNAAFEQVAGAGNVRVIQQLSHVQTADTQSTVQFAAHPNDVQHNAVQQTAGVARVGTAPERIPQAIISPRLPANRAVAQPVFPDLRTVKFTPNDRRKDITTDNEIIGGEQTLQARDSGDPSYIGSHSDRFPDEYIFDGGDRDKPIHFDDYSRHGLDTEDTVAEYLDHRGKFHVKATNRVAIYAPRFGSVRTITSPTGEIAIAKLGGLQDAAYDSAVRAKVGPDSFNHKDRLRGVAMRSRAGGVENKLWQRGVANVGRLKTHTRLLNLYENNAFLLRGEFDIAANARLAFGLKAAMHWTREQNPVVTGQIDATHQLESKFKAAEMVGLDEKHKRDGKLRIVKLASTKTAKSGDVITFVIRYDNLGDRPLQHIKIVDNLTPRLEFLEDSAESDRPGDIRVEDNQEGSLVLVFKLDEALPGKTGGVISFECKVR